MILKLNKFPEGGSFGAFIVGRFCAARFLFNSVAYVPGAIKLWICACITTIAVFSSVLGGVLAFVSSHL